MQRTDIHPAPAEFTDEQLAADPILQFFHYAHLPAALQSTSERFCRLAVNIATMLPRNAERSVALRKLLEAKDAAVRANVAAAPKEQDFLDGLKIERRELNGRAGKLHAFLSGKTGDLNSISNVQRDLLTQQHSAMLEYLAILDARIENIEIERAGGDYRSTARQDEPARELDEPVTIGEEHDDPPAFEG